MLDTEELPEGAAKITTCATDVNRDDFTLGPSIPHLYGFAHWLRFFIALFHFNLFYYLLLFFLFLLLFLF